jgi:hypothetical protein
VAETAEKTRRDPEAPHGRDPDTGEPLAPYGFKTDGSPRLSNRGARGKGRPAAKKTPQAMAGSSAGAKKLREQRDGLVALADAVLSPAMAAMSNPGISRRVGEKRAAGLAGSLLIIEGYVPAYADWVVALSTTRPGLLTWMDRMEDNAPYIQGAIITAQLVKAVASNMVSPDMRLAEAARLKAKIRAAQLADAVEAEARRMGVSLIDEPEPVRQHPDPMDMDDAPRPAGVAV